MQVIWKIVGAVVFTAVLFVGYITFDWYRFATASEIDPARGIFGNDHLEIWIDINARMPDPMRVWACDTLLARQAKAMGGKGGATPYGCDPDFASYSKPMSLLETMISGHAQQAALLAAMQNGATQAQQDQIKACVKADLPAAMTPEMVASLQGELATETLMPINQLAETVRQACLAKAGL